MVEATPTKASILAALSLALDLVEGQPEGHALRTCRIAIRIGQGLGLSDDDLNELYYAALLKDTGCSNNSVRVYNMFGGDELDSKRRVKLIDWTSSVESIKFMFANAERGRSIGAKLRRMASNVGSPSQIMREVSEARCTRGAEIARMLGFGERVSLAIRDLDEHWDGQGAPSRLQGDMISQYSRILCLAQTFEVFVTAFGFEAAYEMAEDRSGRWFEPSLVQIINGFRSDHRFWKEFFELAFVDEFGVQVPGNAEPAMSVDVDRICDAFSMIVDAKSSFTWEHSARVTRYSLELADWFGLDQERRATLRRAALMHDIGKLGISSGILEKQGRLEPEEMDIIRLHPKHSYDILKRVPSFKRIAEIASGHHERLDGNGYWRGVADDDLDLETRILSVADVFDALSSKRPYKDALPLEQVLQIMDRDCGTAFDPECLAGLRETQTVELPLAA